MPNNKQVTVTLKTLADISDVTKRAKDIQDALNKIQLPQKLKTSLDTTFSELYKHVERASEAMLSGFKTKGDVTKYEKSINSINTSLTKLYSNINNIDATKLEIKVDTKEFKELEQRIKDIKQNLNNINTSEVEKLQNLLKQKPSGAAAWGEFLQAISSAEPDFDAAEKALRRLEKQVKNHEEATKQSGSTWETYKNTVDSMRNGLETMKQNLLDNAAALQTLEQRQEDIRTDAFNKQAQDVEEAKTSMEGLTKATANYGKDTVGAARSTQQLGSEIDQFKSRIAYFFGLGNAVRLFQHAVRSAFATVQELDKALTETAVVTNYTVGDMWGKIPEYTERANKLGVTIKDVAEASTLYYQQGLKVNEVNAVTTATLKMARIAGLDAAEATDRMTNALRGFNMEITETNADRIADVYSKLAAISASNVDEISTAMTKTASLASNANMQFENTAAFLAQIIETTRESAETAGTALKTVIARFSEVKELFSRGELLGIDDEGEAIDVNKVSKALRTAGIDLNEYLTGMKGLDDIFMELASKWDSLDTVQQRYIATMAAGSRQQSRFIAMMQDYGRTQELVAAAQNASGAAQEQYQKTLDSLESKLNQLKNAWDDFVTDVVHQQAIKLVVDGLKEFLGLINKLTGNSGIAKLAVSFGAFKIGRGFVANMFKGTKIAELFSKEGAKAGLGFINGIENSIKGVKNFNLKDVLFKNVDLSHTTSNLVAYQNMLDQTFSGTMKLKDAQEQYDNIILASNNLRNTSLTLAEQAVLLDGSETSQKLLQAMATRELTEEERKELQTKAAELNLGKQGLIVQAAEVSRRLLNAIGLKQETILKWFKITADKAEEKALWGLTKAQWASLGAMGAIVAAITVLIVVLTKLSKLTPEGKLKSLEEELEKNTTAASEASEAYNSLNNSLKDLEDKTKTISSLTKGTTEWKNAVHDVNSQILELIDKYPELNKYIEISSDGLLSFKEGYETVLQDYERKADEANFKTAKSRVAVNNQKNENLRSNVYGIDIDEDYYAIRNLPKQIADALLGSEKEAINNKDVEKAIEEYNRGRAAWQRVSVSDSIMGTIVDTVNRSLNKQRANDSESRAANIGVLSGILSNGNYSKEQSDLLKNYINNVDLDKVTDLSDLENKAGDFLAKAGSDSHYARLMSGELQEEDIKWFESNKEDIEKFVTSIGMNFNDLSISVNGVKETFENLTNSFKALGLKGEGWWTGQGSATSANIIDKLGDLSPEARQAIVSSITGLTEGLTDKQRNDFIKQLFGTDWNIDALNVLDTQLETLGIKVKDVDLQNLINQIIEFNKATSTKATAENLKTAINSQNEVVNAVKKGEGLTPEQKTLATNAGIPEDSFVYTAAGWVYTGDPQDLIKAFGQINADTFQDALNTYKNDPNETNRANVNQMAQLMGSSGQSYSREGLTKEGLDNLTKGAEASLRMTEIGDKYIQKARQIEKENKELADSYIRSANSASKLLPKFKDLTDVINDNAEALEKDDPDALAKVAKAASDAFGIDIDSNFIKENKKELIDFANGIEGSFDKISDAIIEENASSINGIIDGYSNLSSIIQNLNWDAEGQVQLNDEDLINKIAQDTNAAADLEAALKAAGIAMDIEWVEEKVPMLTKKGEQIINPDGEVETKTIRVPKKVTLTNALQQQQTVNAKSGGGKSSGGGGSSKPKYWDNPYDELYNLVEKQNEALRVRERLERDYDRILKNRDKTAKELLQNSLNEISNLRKEIQIQEQIQAGRRRMISQLGGQGYRNSEGTKMSFDQWGVTRYASYDYNTNTITIDWAGIDKINDPDKGSAVEAYISKLEELTQSFEETQDQIEEMKDIIQEIKERSMQEYLDFEQRAYDAVIARQQKMIDDYSALSDTISESNNRIVDSLRESIDMERQIRDNTKTEEDIADKEARLEYLRRDTSGANQTEILKLEEELRNSRESYGDTLVDQAIDQLQKDNDLAAEQRSQQIEIMQAQLDWQDKTGYYWEEVYKLIDGAFDENGKVIEDSPLFNLLRQTEDYQRLSKYGKENFDTEGNEQAKQAYEGLYNWEHQNDPEPAPEPTTETSTAAAPPDPAHGNIASAGQLTPINSRRYSAAVERFQQGINDLINAGQLSISPIGVDGYYGNETFRAVKALQSAMGVRADGYWGPNSVAAFNSSSLKRYAKGGLVNSTGLAWLDGTKSAPEMVLSARDTENFIALRNALAQMLTQGIGGKGGDNYFDIQISVDELGSDYDVDQLADRIKKQIYDDSSYRNVNAISYLR